MNRSVEQDESGSHLRTPRAPVGHTIGDRRAVPRPSRERRSAGEATGSNPAYPVMESPVAHTPDPRQKMPYWSAYLSWLGQQVKQAAQVPRWLGVLARPETSRKARDTLGRRAGASSVEARYQVRRPNGDRRMSPEQRRVLLEQSPAQVALKETTKGLDYTIRLGAHLKQASLRKLGVSVAPESPVSVGKVQPQLWHPGQMSAGAGDTQHDNPVNPVNPVNTVNTVNTVKRPIGDRRTGPRQRRDLSVESRRASNRVAEPEVSNKPLYARLALGIWAYYFIAKIVLFGMELIGFHPLENIAFAAFILFPAQHRLVRRAKGLISLSLAVVLLYYDSWLPPIGRVLSQASLLSNFSLPYLIELVARFISWPVLVVLAAVSLVYWMLSRRVNAAALIMAGMLGLWLVLSPLSGFVTQTFKGEESSAADKPMPDMDKVMQNFFAEEANRVVSFDRPKANAAPFDVIFIHVCSLSWDDVRAVGLEQHPLWQRFDILLTKFNSAASYSGPAAIRLLRATCGQQEHGKMYAPVPEKCYLMNSLLRSGFDSELALNHDGKFDDFLGQVQSTGRLTVPPMTLDGLKVAQRAFDGAPVYDDLHVLNRWLELRQKSPSPRVALYYNTVSMHDGNHLPDAHSSPDSLGTYKVRLNDFLDRTEQFMKSLDESGRRAVVVMIPEHGGAVRGDKKQIAGLREIPTPNITLIPVGIKVIGGNVQRIGATLAIDQSVSYLAMSHIIERMLKKSPFNDNKFSPADYVEGLPITPFVSQNEQMTVAEHDNSYYLGRGPSQWERYTEFNTAEARR
ncbi:MAG: cellulose biosynthesis protein BcsG [Gallionella sp.]|nr:cellulose biosynthesis protein BcsG [Gallionella sp.]